MTLSVQVMLDYANEAQIRVAADTEGLTKKTTLTFVPGQQEYPIPDDVIRIRGINAYGWEVNYMSTDTALTILSGNDKALVGNMAYYIIGRTIGFFPQPVDQGPATIFYTARPAQMTSASDFELEGEYQRATDLLALQMRIDDDGQPEVAAQLWNTYRAQVPRLRRNRRGRVTRLPVAGYDQMPASPIPRINPRNV